VAPHIALKEWDSYSFSPSFLLFQRVIPAGTARSSTVTAYKGQMCQAAQVCRQSQHPSVGDTEVKPGVPTPLDIAVRN
jgi:hypothetical protein